MKRFVASDICRVVVSLDPINSSLFKYHGENMAAYNCVLEAVSGERFAIDIIAAEEPDAESLIRRFMRHKNESPMTRKSPR